MSTSNTLPNGPQLEVGHVGINVTELERSARFYTQALELEVMHRSDDENRRFAFLGRDGQLMLTLWQQSRDRFASDRPGLHHLAFQVASSTDIEALEGRLRELDATILHGGVVAHSEASSSGGLFFEDPDGTRLEVYTPDIGERPAPSGEAPACGFF